MRFFLLSPLFIFLLSCSEFKIEQPQQDSTPPAATPQTPPENSLRDPNVCESEEIYGHWPPAHPTLSFHSSLYNLAGVDRDRLVLDEIERGQTGELKGHVFPIKVQTGADELVYCVFGDYLFLKDGTENIRMPLGMTALKEFISNSHWTLPTRLMVNQIYQQGQNILPPQPIPPSSAMGSTAVIVDHSHTINQQLAAPTGLVVGHKKDIVISNRLVSNSQKIAIYGWHRSNGKPIQSLSLVHHKDYADYSHGVRLIYKTVWWNGQAKDLRAILQDPELAPLLSDEGILSQSLISQFY